MAKLLTCHQQRCAVALLITNEIASKQLSSKKQAESEKNDEQSKKPWWRIW
jgi:hypothetical protein